MEKINIAELLQDCPKGMELDCAMYDSVQFDIVQDGNAFPIKINTPEGMISLSKYGCYSLNPQCKCVIFPKGKTTWKGFHRPFVDGDIVVIDSAGGSQVFIFEEYIRGEKDYAHCYLMLDDNGAVDLERGEYYVERFASREEKQKLFQAIKDNGYKWNAETKTLEELNEPQFKEGDKVSWNYDTYKQALLTFGCRHQRMMCMEECAVLIDALAKYDRGRNDSADVITELADVSIMVEQMAEFFGREAYEAERERKMARLQELIETRKKKK